ncbi:MFS transporter [Nonomuraea sp. NPDC048916]|uniref:MFS transporter n=1 Tax=Nonomuraea sp. NPDC048916 TaxID=3154232 RepID=UPI0033F6BE55
MLSRYMVGAVAARTGDEMSGPALLLAALALTGSPAVASWLLAGLTATAAVGGPFLGVLLDRTARPGRMLGRCLLGYATGLVVVLLGLGRVPEVALIGVAALAGLLGPALAGGWTAQLPLVVRPERLAGANVLDSMSYNVAGLAGPALAGVVATAGGGATAMVASVALLLAAVPAARALPVRTAPVASPPPSPRTPHTEPPAPPTTPASSATVTTTSATSTTSTTSTTDATDATDGSPATAVESPVHGTTPAGIREELAAGFRAIASNPALRRATVTSMISFSGVAVLVVSAPLLGAGLAGGAGHGALLLSVTAATALAANAALARVTRWPFTPDLVLAGSTTVLAAAMVIAATAGHFAVAVLAYALAGVAEGPQLTALFSVRHREAPPRLRSQIFTTGASLKITSYAAGAALAGPLAASGTGTALPAGAALQVSALAAYALLSRPSGRSRP